LQNKGLDCPQKPKHLRTPVSEVLDFADSKWSPIYKPGRSPATVKRWESGRARFGDRFVMSYYSQGSGTTGRA
jgi:DNA (cytosine-5)-methyltransferase 1